MDSLIRELGGLLGHEPLSDAAVKTVKTALAQQFMANVMDAKKETGHDRKTECGQRSANAAA